MAAQDTCVIYQYYEKDEIYKQNFLHFLVFGFLQNFDCYIIISGQHTVDLPLLPNFHYIDSENINRDFGGYSAALTNVINVDQYEFFIFLNCTVRGPYLPPCVESVWTEFFKSPLKDDIKLFGSSINILTPGPPYSTEFKSRYGGAEPFSHIQTMSFSIRKEALLILRHQGFFAPRPPLHDIHIVTDFEILLSQSIIRNGGNLKCLIPEYNLIDYRRPHLDINPTSNGGDMLYQGAYFGRTVHPFEVIFAKSNRNLYPEVFLNQLSCSLAAKNIPLPAKYFTNTIDRYISDFFSATNFRDFVL